jgi:hypothetical protein
MGPLFQFHNGNDVGKLIFEGRMGGLVIYDIGIDFPTTAGENPCRVLRMTIRANDRRRPTDMTTFPASLEFQLVLATTIPKWLGIRVRHRQRSFVVHFPTPASE